MLKQTRPEYWNQIADSIRTSIGVDNQPKWLQLEAPAQPEKPQNKGPGEEEDLGSQAQTSLGQTMVATSSNDTEALRSSSLPEGKTRSQ